MNYITKSSKEEKELLERFLRYVKIYSESNPQNADAGIIPSTEQQKEFAKILASELKEMGLCDVQVTENFYVYANLPASKGAENVQSFCLLSHIDTSNEVTGKNVNPQVHENYDGKIISLSNNVTHDPSTDKALTQAASEKDTIITTDGNTLLGADDKAGLAIIMTALSYLVSHQEIRHGKIEIIFSPDEETGHGMDKVPLHLLSSKRAY
ncbi:MAG: peptidase T, partial [Treponema sp.]|nr:peptidase T [Treponema sp.]